MSPRDQIKSRERAQAAGSTAPWVRPNPPPPHTTPRCHWLCAIVNYFSRRSHDKLLHFAWFTPMSIRLKWNSVGKWKVTVHTLFRVFDTETRYYTDISSCVKNYILFPFRKVYVLNMHVFRSACYKVMYSIFFCYMTIDYYCLYMSKCHDNENIWRRVSKSFGNSHNMHVSIYTVHF